MAGEGKDKDKVALKLLLVDGQSRELALAPGETVAAIKKSLWADWPAEWKERPESPRNLRIILRGKFVEDSSTLADNKIPAGETTVAHLTIKAGASEEKLAEGGEKGAAGARCCACTVM